MSGRDKAGLTLAGRPLVGHVRDRLSPQVDGIAISGRRDYGLNHIVLADRDDGVEGPAAGIAAALYWIEDTGQRFDAILTVPADGPFLPDDLASRLSAGQGAAIASAGGRAHPTFGYWPLTVLSACSALLEDRRGLPLMALADAAAARHVDFADPGAFFNINTPADLDAARRRLGA